MGTKWTYTIDGDGKHRDFSLSPPLSLDVDGMAEEAARDFHAHLFGEIETFEVEIFRDMVSLGRRSIEVEHSYAYFVSATEEEES